jgi:RNA polymerase sigma factor (sigma-70 family)
MREETTRELGGHETVLWRVLAALARGGYAVPPSDARDLIHDFYLDAWKGVNERFDPKLGPFATYLAAAFYRFARRRILKLENFKRRTVDFDSAVAQLSTEVTPPDILENRERYQSVNAALAYLTPLERQVLEDYLSGSGLSERQLAQRHRLTRHGVREVLADSLGKVAVTLGRSGASSEYQDNIAELLWKYGQSPRDVAAMLAIPVAEVQAARNQVVARLLAEIRHPNRQPSVGRSKMKHEEALKLLSSAFHSAGNEEVLQAVRKHRADIQQALDEGDLLFDENQWLKVQEHPAWIAAVYDSLADVTVEAGVFDVAHAIDALRHQEEREIGEAFTALLGELPDAFHDWTHWFEGVKPVDLDYQQELASRRSVQYSSEYALALVRYGMTPVTLYAAARGLELLFNRTERSLRAGTADRGRAAPRYERRLPKSVHLVFGAGQAPLELSHDQIIAEVASTPDLPEGAEKPLTWWILSALHFKPYLIDRYDVHADKEAIAVYWMGPHRDYAIERSDLISRWTRGHEEQRQAAAASISARAE